MIVSVVVTNYNYGYHLGRCLRSLLDQSLASEHYEVIVVDDHSTDLSRTIIQAFEGDVRPVYNQANLGVGAACNIGIRKARGRFVVRVDADDYVHRDFLHITQLYLTLNSGICDAVAVDYHQVDENEKIIARGDASSDPIACGILYKLDVLARLGLYNDQLRINEDSDLRRRFLNAGYRLHHLQMPLYRYKKHSGSMTANAARAQAGGQ
jgi:glycosyltransferase involved in cell wall biosynthesis